MKRINQNNLWLSGIAAIVLAMAVISCGPGPGGLDEEPKDFSITGTFKSNEKTSYFKAQKSDGGRAVSRAVGQTKTQPLSGTLDDGDFTLRLKGFYDEESGVFNLSAVSSIIKYSISGTAEGGATASVATRASAMEPFSEPVFVEVSTEVSGAVVDENIARGKATEVVAGLNLENCEGVWYHELAPSLIKYIVSDWGITMAYNEGDGWIENGSIGFSEINDDYIIADFTAIEWVPPRDPADFPAYLASEGWQPVSQDVYHNLPEVTNGTDLLQLLPGYDKYWGVLPVTTKKGTYGVDITYNTTNNGGSEEKPFVVGYRKPNTDGVWDLDEKAFARVEEAIEAVEAQIRTESGDASADVRGLIPEKYTTEYIKLGIFTWENIPRGIPTDEEWRVFHEKMATALHEYDSEEYPDPDKIIFQGGQDYFDLLTAWLDVPNFKTVTKYVKWNVSLVGGKLLMKAYYSGTPNTGVEAWYLDDPAYAKTSFNEAKALTTLPGQNQSTYDGSVTTMVR